MRIAVWHNLPSGGGKRALYYHVKGLVDRGHVVEAWCPPSADQTYLPLSDLIKEHVLPLGWQSRAGRNRLTRFTQDYRNIVSNLQEMDRHCQRCAEEMNQGNFELVYANSCMFFRTTSIGRYVNAPRILYLQEPYRPLYEALPQLPWSALPPPNGRWFSPSNVKRFARDFLRVQALRIQVREEVSNAKAFDAILANSLFSRESILRAYGLDARVCYLGIDPNTFIAEQKPRERFVVGIGAYDSNKNFRFIIEALGLVPEPRPTLVWIGDRGESSTIESLSRLARTVGVCFEPRVRVSDGELVSTLNRAMLLVYAPRLEPFGFAPLEANACGLPVVAVAEGGVRETVIDGVNGLLVEHSHRAMANAVQQLLNDKDYACQLGKNGRRLVEEKWRMAASIDRLERRFAEVLSGYN